MMYELSRSYGERFTVPALLLMVEVDKDTATYLISLSGPFFSANKESLFVWIWEYAE